MRQSNSNSRVWRIALLLVLTICATGLARAEVGWTRIPSTIAPQDIGVGPEGTVYVIGAAAGNGAIFRWAGAPWVRLDGAAVRVAVGPNGVPWVVNAEGHIFRRDGNGWTRLPGLAQDIGVGANGAIFVTGKANGNGGIYRWDGSTWIEIGGGATRLAVGPDGTAWVVNSAGQIYRRDGNSWTRLPGLARDIGVGANGTAYITGPGAEIQRFDGQGWVRQPGGASQVSVDQWGVPWVVNAAGAIYAGVPDPLREECPNPHPLWGCLAPPLGIPNPDSTVYSGPSSDTIYQCFCDRAPVCSNGVPAPPGSVTVHRRSVLVSNRVVGNWYTSPQFSCYVYGRADDSLRSLFRREPALWAPVYKDCQAMMASTRMAVMPRQWCETGCGADYVCDARESGAMTEEANFCLSNLGLREVPTCCSAEASNLQHNGHNCCFIFTRWQALAMGGQGLTRPGFSLAPSPAQLSVSREHLLSTSPPASDLFQFANSTTPNISELIVSTNGSCPGSSTPVRVQAMSGSLRVAECR